MPPKKVFISYSHDSDGHRVRVAGLAASLRRDGVDCVIDQHLRLRDRAARQADAADRPEAGR